MLLGFPIFLRLIMKTMFPSIQAIFTYFLVKYFTSMTLITLAFSSLWDVLDVSLLLSRFLMFFQFCLFPVVFVVVVVV